MLPIPVPHWAPSQLSYWQGGWDIHTVVGSLPFPILLLAVMKVFLMLTEVLPSWYCQVHPAHLPSKICASKLHLTKVLADAHGFTCFNGFSILISIQKMSVFSTDELQLPGRPGSDSLFNYFIPWLKKAWDHPLGRRTSWRRNRGALSQAECILCYGLREPTHAVAHDTFKLGTAAELMTEFQLLLNVKEAVNVSCAGLDSWLGHVAWGKDPQKIQEWNMERNYSHLTFNVTVSQPTFTPATVREVFWKVNYLGHVFSYIL